MCFGMLSQQDWCDVRVLALIISVGSARLHRDEALWWVACLFQYRVCTFEDSHHFRQLLAGLGKGLRALRLRRNPSLEQTVLHERRPDVYTDT